MFKYLVAAAGAALLSFASQGPGSGDNPSRSPESVDWAIAPTGDERAERIQMTLSYRSQGGRSQWSNTTVPADLVGLNLARFVSREGGPVRFQIVRDAGRFDCEGIGRRGRGTGECRFEANAAFAAELEQRGIGRPSPAQSFTLALARVGIDLLEALDLHGYTRPDVDGLVQGGIHGVTPFYVRSMTEAGYHVGALEGLIEMRIHGVSADYVRALARAGYRAETDSLRQLAIHGVSTDFITALSELGYRQLGADQLVALRIHGVTPQFVRELGRLGYAGLSVEQLQSLRIHGVTTDFVKARLRGHARPTPEELVNAKIHGA